MRENKDVGSPVRVIAHRGSNEDEPEHSLAAYLRAIAEGADAVECDVRLAADGTLVCVHDRRVDRTSNGRGAVSGMGLADLRGLEFSHDGRDWRAKHGESDPRRSQVLTLRELLEAVTSASDRVGFAIETKHPTRYGAHVEQTLVETLREFELHRAPERVQVMSFSWLAVQRMRRLMPDLPKVYLVERLLPGIRQGRVPEGTDAVGVSVQTLYRDPGYAERVQARGSAMQVWTVDAAPDVQLAVDLGAEAVISNRPGAARRAIAAMAG